MWDEKQKRYATLRCPDPPKSLQNIDLCKKIVQKYSYGNKAGKFDILRITFALVWYLYPLYWIGSIFIGILGAIVSVYSPKVLQRAIDTLVSGEISSGDIIIYVLLLSGLNIIVKICDFASDRINYYVATQLEDLLKYSAIKSALKQDVMWFDSQSSTNIISYIYAPTFDIVRNIFNHHLISRLIKFIFVLLLILTIEWNLIWLLIPLPIYFISAKYFRPKINELCAEMHKLFNASDSSLGEAIRNHRTVKVFSTEEYELNRFATLWNSRHLLEYDTHYLQSYSLYIQSLSEILIKGIAIGYCLYGINSHKITVGKLPLLMSYIDMLISPLDWVVGFSENLDRWIPKYSKVLDLLSMKSDDIIGNNINNNNDNNNNSNNNNNKNEFNDNDMNGLDLRKEITFSRISFSYNFPELALKEVTFSLPVGKTTALVGRSGAGKSTITQLLLRLYEPTSGKILWDGTDISGIPNSKIRKSIAFVPQEPALFNRTVAENISYGKPGATMSEIIKASRDAFSHNFIIKTPDGYNSLIGENGIKLSGGQRQRLAIARALILDPSVLILDEFSSQLDSESESEIQNYISSAHPNRAQLIIAHRLSTVRSAHNIIVLNEGTIVGQGTYENLLKTCEIFQKFHGIQATSLIDK